MIPIMSQFKYNRFNFLHQSNRVILVLAICFISLSGLAYLAVFGRALGQRENHVGVAWALPRAVFGSQAVRVDDKTYLAKNPVFFIKEMEGRGFGYVEQMGAGYFFEKDGAGYISIGRMYSSQFMLFDEPERSDVP